MPSWSARSRRGRSSSAVGRKLAVRYGNTGTGRIASKRVDMVVLATAARPPEGLAQLGGTLSLEMAEDGFLRAEETHAGLVGSTRPGIYLAGCAGGPKDIPDTVAEA